MKIDRRSDIRLYSQTIARGNAEIAQARFDLVAEDRRRTEREIVRFAARELDEPEWWVRACSEGPHWQDRSASVVDAQVHTAALYVDRGGLDFMPIS